MSKERKLSEAEKQFIAIAIEQYNHLYLPEAEKMEIPIMTEEQYVNLAMENFDKFESNLKVCEALGHNAQTITLDGKPFRACVRCGLSSNQIKTLHE